VRVWCVGNEMDGPWQVGHKDAVAYGKLARETGKAMKLVDPSLELVVVGSSNSAMPTFGAWEDTVLDLTWEIADHISLRTYYDPESFETVDDFLACSRDLDRMIDTVAATADAVAGRKRSDKRIGLLITLLRHADRVRMACIAQLVNVIPPIRTLDGGPAWRQTTFFPFMHAARLGRGTILSVEPDPPGEALEVTATLDPETGARTIFAVNRGAEPLSLHAVLRDAGPVKVAEHLALSGDLAATNTAERPDRVTPAALTGARVDAAALYAELPPRSWNVLRLERSTRPQTRSPAARRARRPATRSAGRQT
jgi:alpha-L-arabinofuranosidase